MNLPAMLSQFSPVLPSPTRLDRFVSWLSPSAGLNRLRARAGLGLISSMGGYTGARSDRPALKEWNPASGSADDDTIADLPTLRSRSRDLIRNAPIATGAVSTQVMSVIGPGLTVLPQVDREALGLTDDAADAWERRAARYFSLWANSKACDITGRMSFGQLQALAFRAQLESGDVLVVRRHIEVKGDPFATRLQLIEADRISNPDFAPDTDRLAGGVQTDELGRVLKFHIADRHPGSGWLRGPTTWTPLEVQGEQDARVLYLGMLTRPGQSRAVPYLAPVIEPLKQLDRYTHSELAAAVVSSFFTVFVTKPPVDPEAGGLAPGIDPATGQPRVEKSGEITLGPASIWDLSPGEKIETTNPGRPNDKFDPFVIAILRQIGVSLDLPFELLVKHFTASYSAARAALNEAWRAFLTRREFLVRALCQPVYEWWLAEAVARGYLSAPGFFKDPLTRAAWSSGTWTGPVQGQLNPLDEVRAARERIEGRLSTEARETAALSGADWEADHRQRTKERRANLAAGLDLEARGAPVAVPTTADQRDAADRQVAA